MVKKFYKKAAACLESRRTMQPPSRNGHSPPEKHTEIERLIRKNKIEIAVSLAAGFFIILLMLVHYNKLLTESYIPGLIIFSIIFFIVRQIRQNILFIRSLESMIPTS
jgi:hypothetical protein